MLNVVVLNGRLTADPELRYTQSNVAVTSFTLAVDRSFARQGTERVTDFINIVAWRQAAEFVGRYFHKGQLVAVQGSLQVRSYTDKDGNNRRVYEVVADQVHFAESKRDNYGSTEPSYSNAPSQEAPSFSSVDAGDFEEIQGADDDLPF